MSGGADRGAPTRPLADIRVLDFGQIMAGPHCTRLLADLGAEVIKIEPPTGDAMRTRKPLREGASAYFGHMNGGKRSVCLDLAKADGRRIAGALAARCDVLVESFRPGVMQRFGLDYATLGPQLPRLVYCSISGFGQTGPYAQRPAFAPLIHAMSGHDLAHMGYQDEAEAPPRTAIFAADVLTGVYAFGAIQAALLQRQRTGGGQHIDTSILESMASLLIYELQEAQFPSDDKRLIYTPLRAADGFVIVAPFTEKNYRALFRAIGRAELADDPRFATHRAREAHWQALMALVQEWTAGRPVAECERLLLAADCPAARYREVAELLDDPQLAHRHHIARIEDAGGAFSVPNPPFLMSDAATATGGQVPALGEHTREVLAALLDYDEATLDALCADGTAGPAP